MAIKPITRLPAVSTYSALPTTISLPALSEGVHCWVSDVQLDHVYLNGKWLPCSTSVTQITVAISCAGVFASNTLTCNYRLDYKQVTLTIPRFSVTPLAPTTAVNNPITLTLPTSSPAIILPIYEVEETLPVRNNVTILTIPTLGLISQAIGSNIMTIYSTLNKAPFTTVVPALTGGVISFSPKTIIYPTA